MSAAEGDSEGMWAAQTATRERGPRKRHGAIAFLRLAAFLLIGAATLLGGGFAAFSTHVSHLLTPSDPKPADAIIVLTGGQARIDAALALLKSGKGERLLISGVHPSTGRAALRAATGGDAALFSCCVDIDYDALDTVGNAEQSAKWVESHAYRSVILVTNNYHMPRSLLEMDRLLGTQADVTPYPVVNAPLDLGRWMVRPEALRVLSTEYAKYLASLARGILPEGLRPGHMALTAEAAAHQEPAIER